MEARGVRVKCGDKQVDQDKALWWFFPVFLPNVKANFCWINLLPVKKRAGDFKNCQEGFQNLRAAEIKHGRVPGI